jgi:SHS2 domain-containing protein
VKKYEFIEHTADIGIRVNGRGLKELFSNAALAMFDIVAEKEKKTTAKQEEIKIKQQADNLEELFINWLNELLSLSSAKELIFSAFKINKLDKTNIEAIAIGRDFKNYKVNTEIKAATYHRLKLEETKTGWVVEVIFDV